MKNELSVLRSSSPGRAVNETTAPSSPFVRSKQGPTATSVAVILRTSLTLTALVIALHIPSTVRADCPASSFALERNDLSKDLPQCSPLNDKTDGTPEFITALRFFQGDGVTRNTALAFALFQRSAENGHKLAQYNLGCLYLQGRGPKRTSARLCAG